MTNEKKEQLNKEIGLIITKRDVLEMIEAFGKEEIKKFFDYYRNKRKIKDKMFNNVYKLCQ